MDGQILALLLQDGVTVGAVYVLLATSLVLVFNVTRIVFVPQGEFVAFAVLTLAAFENGAVPPTVWLLFGFGGLALAMELAGLRRAGAPSRRRLAMSVLLYLAVPAVLGLLSWQTVRMGSPRALSMALSVAIVVALAPSLYRVAFRPIADAAPLTLLIAALALHFVLRGLGLYMFGPEGVRTQALADTQFHVGALAVSLQSVWIVAASAALIAALYFFFGHTLYGKALRASAISRRGAQLMGISIDLAGVLALTIAAFIGAVSGILIGPVMTVNYSTGFLLALKGFVGAIVGGLAVYPAAAAGALLVGILEAFASFWASSWKDAIVFILIVPVLLWRSTRGPHIEEEAEE